MAAPATATVTTPTVSASTEASAAVPTVGERFLRSTDKHQPRQHDQTDNELFHGTPHFPVQARPAV
jgi:hypothetical protein